MSDSSNLVQNAKVILRHAEATTDYLISLYGRKGRGGTTDQQQDVLRSSLLFASSGLDAVVKQLITDCLKQVILRDIGAFTEFESFILRKIKQTKDVPEKAFDKSGYLLLAKSLASNAPQAVFLNDLKESLTKGSLQSLDQLLKVAANFGITTEELLIKPEQLKEAFEARNQIAHEMDINLLNKTRRRRTRDRTKTSQYKNWILVTAKNYIIAVEKKLTKPPLTLTEVITPQKTVEMV